MCSSSLLSIILVPTPTHPHPHPNHAHTHTHTRLEVSLQQNEIMDIFADDYKELSETDVITGNKSDTNLKEYQSFTDLKFSKDKVITWIDWHPTIKGKAIHRPTWTVCSEETVIDWYYTPQHIPHLHLYFILTGIIAVSCGQTYSFNERIELSSRLLLSRSLILIWSFTDPIHPQLFLEAPDDVLCFKFNPSNPNVVVGGCANGQIVLWDLEEYQDRLQLNKTTDVAETRGTAANLVSRLWLKYDFSLQWNPCNTTPWNEMRTPLSLRYPYVCSMVQINTIVKSITNLIVIVVKCEMVGECTSAVSLSPIQFHLQSVCQLSFSFSIAGCVWHRPQAWPRPYGPVLCH